ncbi:MAG: pyrroline-5-carboxylate reductase [Thermodesulfobacteriota bacterium]
MLTDKTIGFIGAGNMAEALIKGLISAKVVSAGQITASDRAPERLAHIKGYGVKVCSKSFEVASASDILFPAVKPQDLEELLEKDVAKHLTGDKLLISVVAGKTTDTIREALGRGGLRHPVAIVRAMPNTPALVGQGAIGLYSDDKKSTALKVARTIFEAVGRVVEVEDETLMDAVTGLSGSGPAYVFLFMEALIEAGVKEGLPADRAKELAVQTVLGSAMLARESEKDLRELIDMVTSPGGTTIEGLKKLEDGKLRDAIAAAVEAATKRARELSGTG